MSRQLAAELLRWLTVFFVLCLQAVETNLASKDSHWVFVNEVTRPPPTRL